MQKFILVALTFILLIFFVVNNFTKDSNEKNNNTAANIFNKNSNNNSTNNSKEQLNNNLENNSNDNKSNNNLDNQENNSSNNIDNIDNIDDIENNILNSKPIKCKGNVTKGNLYPPNDFLYENDNKAVEPEKIDSIDFDLDVVKLNVYQSKAELCLQTFTNRLINPDMSYKDSTISFSYESNESLTFYIDFRDNKNETTVLFKNDYRYINPDIYINENYMILKFKKGDIMKNFNDKIKVNKEYPWLVEASQIVDEVGYKDSYSSQDYQ